MNQDFTVQKKAIFFWKKKKNSAEGFTWKKKNPAEAVSKKKKKNRASWKFPNPPTPITFLMVRPLPCFIKTKDKNNANSRYSHTWSTNKFISLIKSLVQADRFTRNYVTFWGKRGQKPFPVNGTSRYRIVWHFPVFVTAAREPDVVT